VELEQIALWVLVLSMAYQFLLNCIGLVDPLYYTIYRGKQAKKRMEYQEEQYNKLNRGEKVWVHKIASACALGIQGLLIFALLKALNVI
jgi:hypothetical protein